MTSFGNADALYEEERDWIPDNGLRRWYVSKVAASPQPIETYRQPIQLLNPEAENVPHIFFRLTENGSMFDSLFEPTADRFRNHPEWQYDEIQTNHCGPIVAPGLISQVLLDDKEHQHEVSKD